MTQRSRFSKIMRWSALLSCLLCIFFSVLFSCFHRSAYLSLAITAGTFAFHFTMRLVVGLLIPTLTRTGLNPDSLWFRSKPFERKLYRLLHVRRWKGKMPTYNPQEFSLSENSPERIIQNSCSAEKVHEVIMATSFLPLLAAQFLGAFPVFLISSILAALGDGCFVIMQRYNRPRFQKYSIRKASKSGRRNDN